MEINITGHHVDLTPELKQFTQKKFKRIPRHFTHKITSIHVVLTVEKLRHIASATVHFSRGEVNASRDSKNMYSAIDELVDIVNRQLMKYKEKMTDRD